MFQIDINSITPLYEQLKQQIIELQLLGLLQADDALPSVRALAKQLGINPNTVSKAYSELEQNKVIYTIAGKGCYVSSANDILNKHKQTQVEQYIKLHNQLLKYGYSEEELTNLRKGGLL